MRLRRKLYLVNRELSLSPDSDRVAVEAYETCLRGWEQATAIDRRVRRIERALAGHRKRLGQAPRASRTPPTRDPRSGSPTTQHAPRISRMISSLPPPIGPRRASRAARSTHTSRM